MGTGQCVSVCVCVPTDVQLFMKDRSGDVRVPQSGIKGSYEINYGLLLKFNSLNCWTSAELDVFEG